MNVVKKVFFIALMIWMIWVIKSYAETATINAEGARIRREPNTSSDVLTIAYSGETVEIIEKSGEWYKVKYGESVGYIREDLMSLNDGGIEDSSSVQEDEESQDVQEQQEQVEPDQAVSQDNPENLDEQESHTEVQNVVFQEMEKQLISDSNVRIIPNVSASSVCNLNAKTKVTVTQVINLWSCIRYEDKTGWIPSCFLTDIVEEPKNEEQQTRTGYVNVSGAIIRKGPSTSAEIITEWGQDKPVEIVGEEGDWYKINFNGEEAYVAKRLISDTITSTSRGMQGERELLNEIEPEAINYEELEDVEDNTVTQEVIETVKQEETVAIKQEETTTSISKGEEVVALAKQYLGCSYVYGGSGPKSFDCSGFTQYIYKQFGISLTHSAVTQANSGTYVAKSDLQLGDLVIFRDWDNSGIGHCGIYIGGGNFIHAANSTRGVVTDTLNSGYYYERYVSGRRLF